MPGGVKGRLKRAYANAREVYGKHSCVLDDLRKYAADLPPGILEPAIDYQTDLVDAAEKVLRSAYDACVKAGVDRAYGKHIRPYGIEGEPNYDE